MVSFWILNSISKEIAEAFLYTNSKKALWEEIKKRFGECSGPLIYQMNREISCFNQEVMSVAVYFTKLKKL